MPHVVFETPLSLQAIPEQFEASDLVYIGDDCLFIDVYVKAQTIDQRVAFAIIPHDNQPSNIRCN